MSENRGCQNQRKAPSCRIHLPQRQMHRKITFQQFHAQHQNPDRYARTGKSIRRSRVSIRTFRCNINSFQCLWQQIAVQDTAGQIPAYDITPLLPCDHLSFPPCFFLYFRFQIVLRWKYLFFVLFIAAVLYNYVTFPFLHNYEPKCIWNTIYQIISSLSFHSLYRSALPKVYRYALPPPVYCSFSVLPASPRAVFLAPEVFLPRAPVRQTNVFR